MNNPILTLHAISGAFSIIKATHDRHGIMGQCGISGDSIALLMQDAVWQQPNRAAVEHTLQALRDGIAHACGYPPFRVPAEYMAALVVHFVSPVNYHPAAAWFAGISVPATDLAAGAAGSSEPVSASQLFALINLAYDNNPAFAAMHDSKVRKQQTKVDKPQGAPS